VVWAGLNLAFAFSSSRVAYRPNRHPAQGGPVLPFANVRLTICDVLRGSGFRWQIVPAILLGILYVPIWAQTTDSQTPSKPGGYVFHANTREVLTDVTVTDNDGNPVRGLSRSVFHIFDNNRAEQLESFEEHAGTPATLAAVSTASNVFSNAYLLHPPPSISVILLDTTNIDIVDQMFLNQELTKLVKELPANQSLAIYQRASDGTILLQNFTSDHNLLLTAIHRAIPRLRQVGSWYASDFATLQQIAVFLGQVPGRKNVLWFTGGSNLFLRPDPTSLPSSEFLRDVYDELETERIALYPIDARGLTADLPTGMTEQHMLMANMAEATGGQASYNNNSLAQTAARVLDTDADFYTLTYRPDDLKANNKWHKVKISMDAGPYRLSYRRGYFDDGTGTLHPPRRTRLILRSHGNSVQGPDRHTEPIIFEARVEPSIATRPANPVQPGVTDHPPKRNELAYAVHYSVPVDSLTQETVNGEIQVSIGAAILAFNRFGRATGHEAQKLTFAINAEKLKANPTAKLGFEQQINLPKGEDYLYIALWDMTNGRLGTLQLPLDVEKTK
jgi:VWFA-related protein